MKNIADVLKRKEAEFQQIQVEIEALRLAMRLVSEEGDEAGSNGRVLAPTGTDTTTSRVEEIKAAASNRRWFP